MILCGIDEAGRGPLAGPVTAAAVILPENFPVDLLDDSKKLKEKDREKLYILIKNEAVAYAIDSVEPDIIDKINILEASMLAMRNAYIKLNKKADLVLIDGNRCPALTDACKAVIRGDSIYPCIMAASILAKVERDHIMLKYHDIYPAYGFDKHKGYPTVFHRKAILQHGFTPIHRLTFHVKNTDNNQLPLSF